MTLSNHPEARLIARSPKVNVFLLGTRIHVMDALTDKHLGSFQEALIQILDFDEMVHSIITQ